mgnify:CR=1 FL=1
MAFIRTTANAISSGGTINGDITITGDLTVEGEGTLSFDETIEGTQVIDVTDTEAFLVRKNGDGGDLFTVDTTNSDVAVGGLLTIDQDTVGSNAITIDTEATTGRGIDIAADALTSGHIAYFYSNSSSTTGRNLVEIHNDNASASAAIPLKIVQDAPANAFIIDMNGNRNSINITSDSTTYSMIYTTADSLTTGSMAYFKSNSSSTSTRNLVEIHNDHASATGATGLKIINDSTGSALTAVGAAGSGSASGAVVKLQTAETTVVDGDYLGRIEFSAPSEADGSDATLTGAQIHAEASDTFSGTVNKTDLVFSTGASEAAVERMRINSAGQFGLNVDNQDSYYAAEFVLGASNQGGITIRGGTSDTGQYLMFADGASGAARYQGYVQYAHSDNQMHFATGASERMTIDANGVGIGTTDPGDALHIVSASDGGATEVIIDNSAAGDSTDELVGFRFRHNGGTAAKIQVGREENFANAAARSGFISFKTSKDDTEAEKMRITADGNIEVTSGALQIKTAGQELQWVNGATKLTGADSYLEFNVNSARRFKLDGNSVISLSNNDDGTSNTILGKNAGDSDGAGDNNVFVGELAGGTGTQTDAADNNVGVGYSALTDLTTGADNTSIGQSSLAELTTGSYNTSVGRLSTPALTTGSHNVVIGRANLYEAADDESNNIVIGNSAMGSAKQNGTASATNREVKQNIAIGTDALTGGTLTGTNHLEGNVAIGHLAMDATGANNQIGTVAIGTSALSDLTSGSGNTAIGYKAADSVTTGSNNTALGYEALIDNLVGSGNTAIGRQALYDFVADSAGHGWNTAVGEGAGYDVSTGTSNTIIGASAANAGSNDLTTGDANTLVGSETSTSASGALNQNVFGYGVVASGNGTFTFGHGGTDTTCTNGATTWSNPSDERIKKDINDSSLGLSFINDLKPRTFKYKTKGELPSNHTEYIKDSTDLYREDKTYHGFIAQEVKEAIDNAGDKVKDGFEGWATNATNDFQRVGETAFIGALIKSVQELSARVEELEKK